MSWFKYASSLKEQLNIIDEYIGQLEHDVENGKMSPLARRILIADINKLKGLKKEYGGFIDFVEGGKNESSRER